MSIPPEATSYNDLTKLLVLQPLRANSKRTFQCETPCIWAPAFFKHNDSFIATVMRLPNRNRHYIYVNELIMFTG